MFILGGIKMKKLVLTLPFLFLANLALASGFALYEFSARGNAMGGAVLAGDAEPASLALNPALITELPGKQIQAGATFVTATGGEVYGGVYDGNSKRQLWPLPSIYYTQQIAERWWLGLGAMARFGLSNDYTSEEWMLPNPKGVNLYHVGVTTYSIQPTVAFKATDKLSVSLGVEAQYLNFTEKLRFATGNGLDLDGDSVAISGILGLFYKANEKVNFGASFRYRSDHSVRGPAKYDFEAAGFKNGGDFWGDISFPGQLGIGFSYKPIEKLLIEFNWTNVFWSCFKAVNIYMDNLPGSGSSGLMGSTQENTKHYQDAYRVGVGAEYTLNDVVKLRGSFIYDKSPLNRDFMDVMLPVDDRYIIGTGVGLNLSKNTILDLSYSLLLAPSLDGTAADHTTPVHYKSATSHLFGFSVRYKF